MGRLFWKIFFGFWITMVLIAVGVGFAVHTDNKRRLARMTDISTGHGADLLVSSAATSLELGGELALKKMFSQWPRRAARRVFIVDNQGRDIFGRKIPAASLAVAREELKDRNRSRGLRRIATPGGKQYVLFIPSNPEIARQRLANRPPRPRRFKSLLTFWLTSAVIASLLFSFGLAWYLARPVRYLRDASRRFATGDLMARVMPRIGGRRDDIADLGKDFDDMAEQLQALISAQKRLLHDVSHELRSPLARLQVAVGLAQQQPDKLAETLERIERETERLDELVGQVLTLSRLEARVSEGNDELVDLAALLGDVVADANFEAEASGRRVELVGAATVTIRGHAELLHRALENVIRNAIKYTAEDTTVEVSLTQDKLGRLAQITVCDQGPGVPEAELDSLFDPFVRLRSSESNVGGYGLGLAIARRAISAHAGQITARNRDSGGLCIDIRLKIDR